MSTKPTSPATDIPVKPKPDLKATQLANLKLSEKKTLAKLEKIKNWPKEHQTEATTRATIRLNQIREEMKKLV